MSGFKDILGNKEITEHFINGIKSDKVSHAYIINGEEGMGKKTVVKAVTMFLQCEEAYKEPCQTCKYCMQAISENHPDIIRILHEKPGSIGVEEIREQIVGDVQVRPYSGRYKIYIIDEAEKLTIAAQNAILKTLEEPPEYAIIIMLSANNNSFLSTILSRCILLNMRPLSE
jgi:DNA polymerase-3 subunit delta'